MAVKISLTKEQAQALHWFARHLSFNDALASTPPHFNHAAREECAYTIVHAAAELEEQIRKAGAHGDSWMYRHE